MGQSSDPQSPPRIVIVGGGAGGLELATRLGNSLGRRGRAEVTLVDDTPVHVWKPLLHEAAAGTLDVHDNEVEYLAQAKWHHFKFRLGRMDGLDRRIREISLAPTVDVDGVEILPRRQIGYDVLVIAVGSVSNDLGVPGVKEYSIALDTLQEANAFQRELIRSVLRAQAQPSAASQSLLNVAIVGAGATGVELAAQLHDATWAFAAYGLEKLDPGKNVRLIIFGSPPRVLPDLPERTSAAVAQQLHRLGVVLHTGQRVVKVTPEGVYTRDGLFEPAHMVVWAAGIKAPDFLRDIDGLETNQINQLMVLPTLQTTRDPAIFAFGDCACCPMPDSGRCVPPRAQAAHQQASLLAKSIPRLLRGQPLPAYHYRDFGSLVSLGHNNTIGNLMGGLARGHLFIEGKIAKLMYWSLYKMHQVALFGYLKTFLLTVSETINKPNTPPVKLH